MKISFHWLCELLPSLKTSPQELAKRLTLAGLEVEAIHSLADVLNGVVVAEVVEKDKHPQADRLSLCKVFDGKETHQVVCGAPNVRAGGKFPLALLGTRLPNGMEMKPATIRGVESFGMLCSAKELGLAVSAEGILELAPNAKVGTPLARHLGQDDTILEINVTPNRGDCLSHWGVAREVATLFKLSFDTKKTKYIKGSYPIKSKVKVQIKDSGCYRYCSRLIEQVKVGPSPAWLVQRLANLEIRSVNNVVDATNWVLMETGHPVHAFDFSKIAGGKISVRKAGEPQKFLTLDHVERNLEATDLLITDENGPVALAGIMGGKNSEITPETTSVLLEAASFDPSRIRATSKRLGVHTDSSHRFERFVSPSTVAQALNRLTSLILEIAGGEASFETLDLYPQKKKWEAKSSLVLRPARLAQVVGQEISDSKVAQILKSLGLSPEKNKKGFKIVPPAYRPDLVCEEDLIEEVVRLVGFDFLESCLPSLPLKAGSKSPSLLLEEKAIDFMAARGFSETINYSFGDEASFVQLGLPPAELLKLANPLSEELAVLRPTLLTGLIQAFKTNRRFWADGVKFFECRSVFLNDGAEEKHLSGLYTGPLFPTQWKIAAIPTDIYFGKGVLEALSAHLGFDPVFLAQPFSTFFHPGQSLTLTVKDKVLGGVGALHPEIALRFELPQNVFYFEVNLSVLTQCVKRASIPFKAPSPYPTIARDLSLVAEKSLAYETLVEAIRAEKASWLSEITLFDVYEGERLPEGKKGWTLALTYESEAQTLTDEDVNRVHFGIVDSLCKNLGVQLRS